MTEKVFFSTQIASCTAVLVSSARFQRFNGITVGKATWSIMIEAQSGVRRWSHICKWGKKGKQKVKTFETKNSFHLETTSEKQVEKGKFLQNQLEGSWGDISGKKKLQFGVDGKTVSSLFSVERMSGKTFFFFLKIFSSSRL